ncbi:MAG: hypothetical protein WC460_02650 [Patescibacteria group bacterium]
MTNQEQKPDKNVREEKIHPTIIKLAKIALKEYLVNLPADTSVCYEDIKSALQLRNVYLNWYDTAQIILPMITGKTKVRDFRFWFRKMDDKGKADCLTIWPVISTKDSGKASCEAAEGGKNEAPK